MSRRFTRDEMRVYMQAYRRGERRRAPFARIDNDMLLARACVLPILLATHRLRALGVRLTAYDVGDSWRI